MAENTTAEVGLAPASVWYSQRVKTKLAMGAYQTEPVACFCGSTSTHLVTDTDRYGLPHAMQLCKDCGILYANPRMTDATYASFYANEYRHIYRNDDDSAEQEFQTGQTDALWLKSYLEETYALRPTVVFDIGCNAGGWLQPFVDAGCEVHGVDYGPERVAFGQQKGLPIAVGSIEALEIMGLKADLIIMNHVLEHVTNLESTLHRVRDLLSDKGLLYVALPGLYASNLQTLFQQAHPWQFTAETLGYVMECCGFEELRVNEYIVSLWRKAKDARLRGDKPTTNVRYIADYLVSNGTRLVPILRTSNKFKLADRRIAIASATSRGLPEITELIRRYNGGSAVIIGGGPSVDGYIEKIRQLQLSGSKILCIERMYRWCQEHGITPEYVVAQDASTDVVEAFETIQPGSIFLLSSQCQPAAFDAIAGRSVYFFHTLQRGIPQSELTGPTEIGVQVNSGGSVTLCAMSLSMLLGLGDLHVFGFDCHLSNGGYATGITGVGEQTTTMQISIEDRIFTTTPAYLSFAQQFFPLKDLGERGGLLSKVTVYGDSLVTAMCEQIERGDV